MSEVAIIVPVLGRPEHANVVMASLRENTRKGVATVYAICESNDSAAASWDAEGATVFLVSPKIHTFAAKANYGYRNTKEPWVLPVGSDVFFHRGWWQAITKTAQRTNAQVVGTMDGHPVTGGGNQRVTLGQHSVHNAFRRRYVDERGGCWDGPGVLCHEGYLHTHVDDEWWLKARLDGVLAMADKCFIEHLHPYFHKGEMDAVYREGEASFTAGAELFGQRVRQFTQLLDGVDA